MATPENSLALLMPVALTVMGAFVAALVAAPSIDRYRIGLFLVELARTEPLAVIELLEARVESAPRQAAGMYSPLPFQRDVAPPFRDHDDFPALLRQVGDWIAADPDPLAGSTGGPTSSSSLPDPTTPRSLA
ncbi:hypothetical protein [Streptomyces sp. NPDC090029]|uniref:hypothetical protein n=1 Tax=Streptomyces sp. NPDC090029 TaxID=3365924 RepID=UPI00380D71AE